MEQSLKMKKMSGVNIESPLYDKLVSISPLQYAGLLITISATTLTPFAALFVALIYSALNLHLEYKRARDYHRLKELDKDERS